MTKYVIITLGEDIIGATPIYCEEHEKDMKALFTDQHKFTEVPSYVCRGVRTLLNIAIDGPEVVDIVQAGVKGFIRYPVGEVETVTIVGKLDVEGIFGSRGDEEVKG